MKTAPDISPILKSIQTLKQEAHDRLSLYIDLNASDLTDQLHLSEKDLSQVQKAMKESMLEGDQILSKPKSSKGLSIRYYVDNLYSFRRKTNPRSKKLTGKIGDAKTVKQEQKETKKKQNPAS